MNRKYINKLAGFFMAALVLFTSACQDPEPILFDGPFYVGFNVTRGSIAENSTDVVSIPIGLAKPNGLGTALEVSFTVTSTTATEGVDFELVTPSPVTIPAGEYLADIQFRAINDEVFNAGRSITLTLTGTNSTEVGAGVDAEGVASSSQEIEITIVNDDCPVNSAFWSYSDLEIEDQGFSVYTCNTGANEAGECNVLKVFDGLLTDFGVNYGIERIELTPDSEGATFGTVEIPQNVAPGAATNTWDSPEPGTYTETPNAAGQYIIQVPYSLKREDGSEIFPGTFIFYGRAN